MLLVLVMVFGTLHRIGWNTFDDDEGDDNESENEDDFESED